MKFKVLPGTELFGKLWALHLKIESAKEQITAFLKSKGFTGQFATDRNISIVSCDAIEMLSHQSSGYKSVGAKYQALYYPLAKNKKDLAEIRQLPRIKVDELNELVDFSFCVSADLEIYHSPGISFNEKHILIETGNANYTPVEGMIEIKESEYNKLSKEIK